MQKQITIILLRVGNRYNLFINCKVSLPIQLQLNWDNDEILMFNIIDIFNVIKLLNII